MTTRLLHLARGTSTLLLIASLTTACSSGTRGAAGELAPSLHLVSEASRSKLPTWVAHDGAYEIVARDVRDIAAVQPGIEREFETFRAIHGSAPRPVQFVVVSDGDQVDALTARLAERDGMERVVLEARAFAARPLVAPWTVTRTNAEGRP